MPATAPCEPDREPGFLARSAIKPVTRLLYDDALSRFDKFCRDRTLPCHPWELLAQSMIRFFEHEAARHITAAIGRNVFYGYLRLRASNRKLAAIAMDPARDALAAWPRVVKEQVRDPLPEDVWFWLLEWMAQNGSELEATAGLISYDTYPKQ